MNAKLANQWNVGYALYQDGFGIPLFNSAQRAGWLAARKAKAAR